MNSLQQNQPKSEYLRKIMKLQIDDNTFIDTNEPLDISLPLTNDDENPKAWYVNKPDFEPVRTEFYTGSVEEGGSVNFRNIFFNPHGHGTHTECLGHITQEVYSVNKVVKNFFFMAELISVQPVNVEMEDGVVDAIILPEQLRDVPIGTEALVIRTLPNEEIKKHLNYSSTNPPYMQSGCVDILLEKGVKHLLIDLPSVDREEDNGVLAFHHAFWEVPENPNFERTITELIYVDNGITDGSYLLNLQIASFENDATPSKPVLYALKKKKS